LNLSYETREGIVKHNSPHDIPKNSDLTGFNLHEQAPLEAQIGNLADEIAYNNHDIDDGVRAGILTISGLKEVELFHMHYEIVDREFPGIEERMAVSETVRRMINHLILDVIEESGRRIKERGVESLEDVRKSENLLVGFSQQVRHMNGELKRHLLQHMYKHYRVVRMAVKAEKVIQEIFSAYIEKPEMLPEGPQERLGDSDDVLPRRARVIADYIAGMTDRYALEEYDRLFNLHART
jgi:dGTPase